MSNQKLSNSFISENESTDCEDTTNDTFQLDANIVDTAHETVEDTTECNIPVIAQEIFLPNGQVMNAKTTMQSFDAPTPRGVVATAVKLRSNNNEQKIQPHQVFLPSGELINAKNTARSYHFDVENQDNIVTRNGNETVSSSGVIAEVALNRPTNNRRQFVDEVNVEAYAVQSYIVAKTEPLRPWLTKRFLYLMLLIVVLCSAMIGTGVYCGLGNCTPSGLPEVLPTTSPGTPEPTSPPTFTYSTMSSTTFKTNNPATSPTNALDMKESTITAYINSITLSNRNLSVNGTTAEDLALSWIVHEDPIFTDIEDSIWSTLLLSSPETASISSTRIRLRQRYALLSLWFQQPLIAKRSTSVVQNWRNTSGWLKNENECYWYGVDCSLIDMGGFIGGQRIVTEIDFYNNDVTLQGGNNITGTIPAELGLLTSLNRIDLSDNNFYGTIPENLFEQWASIESINIGNNNMTGTIPGSIGQLSTLKILNITNNQISGTIPESIGRCKTIERCDVGGNQLTGPLPDSIGNWNMTKVFNVRANQLNGTLPTSIGNWTALTDFYIYNNRFHGSIPDKIGDWYALRNFNIEYNIFTGSLPYTIGQLSTVRRFDVSDNMLTGTIPESIGNCTSLEFFSIEDNIFDGPIPSTIGMLTSLTTLFLHSNKLTGTIPDVVGRFTSLQYISAKHNQLSGTIPLSVGNWSNIVSAHFYNNSFSGTVPNILCTFNALNITADCDLVCDCCNLCV